MGQHNAHAFSERISLHMELRGRIQSLAFCTLQIVSNSTQLENTTFREVDVFLSGGRQARSCVLLEELTSLTEHIMFPKRRVF
jgi:hypothetical protein